MALRIASLLGLLSATLFLPGCADDRPAEAQEVSSIPWNRPEKWEGQGAMGGFAPQGTGGGF